MPVDVLTHQHHKRAAFDVYHAYVGDDSDSSNDDEHNRTISPSNFVAGGSSQVGAAVGYGSDEKQFDPVTFNVLRVQPEDFASQITLLDLPVFQQIQPEELVTCGWTTKEKMSVSPNVVAFTRRFNHVCLWCQREILSRQKPKLRADVITHFIRIAKRLLDLNNLHSARAIVSGLQSSPIHRLRQSWAVVPIKDRVSLDKMAKLFSEEDNFEKLRKHMEIVKLPCIPYLGLYLTDLVYIDVAHPSPGSLNGGQRSLLMNNIIRVLAEWQRSEYKDLRAIECVQNFLQSIRYIDELQKFVEDDLYKQSVELEPITGEVTSIAQHDLNASYSGNKKAVFVVKEAMARRESLPIMSHGAAAGHHLSLAHKNDSLPEKVALKANTIQVAPPPSRANQSVTVAAQPPIKVKSAPFYKSHRKAQSLGNPSQFKFMHDAFPADESLPGPVRHLLDDSVLDFDTSCTATSTLSSTQAQTAAGAVVAGRSSATTESTVTFAIDDSGLGTGDDRSKTSTMQSANNISCLGKSGSSRGLPPVCIKIGNQMPPPPDAIVFEGAVRRKTIMKHGRKPAVAAWNRYWCILWDTNLCYAAVRSLPSRRMDVRTAYKTKPYKMMSITNWMVILSNDPYCPDGFQLQEPSRGHVYKFRAGTQAMAMQWVQHLKTASKKHERRLPENLIAFD